MNKRGRYKTKKLVQGELDILEYEIRLHLERYERLRGIIATHGFLTKIINERWKEVSKNLATNKKSAGEVLTTDRSTKR